MLKNKKHIFRLLALLVLIGASLLFTNLAFAQIDAGTQSINEEISLSANNPITTAARIINITLLFLGILAVGLIIWGGFVWMTSNGEEDKVEQAKKILKNGVIGLAIILASWGIASFVISRLIGATNGGNGSGCTDGQSLSCGCGGSMSCIDGSWGVCFGSNCHGGGGPVSCDSDPLPGCQAASQICAEDSYCDSGTCTCVAKGELGDSCDADTETPVCEADNSFCAEYLTCSTDTCTCVGAPVITEVSPAGGFCNENQNKSCQNDSDCSSGCNLLTPNGAVDNIITILGANFGNYDPANSKVVFGGNAVGVSPTTINSDCVNSWTNNQIIVAVPAGAVTGAVKVIAADNQSDVTNDDRGPMIPDFNVNNIIRPGLCLLTPDSGALSQQLGYRGINLYGAEAYFGKYSKNVPALDSMFNNPAGIIGTGTIPNVDKGRMSSFVVAQIGDSQERSNYVSFTKQADLEAGPFISYFEPTTGRAGQYITIHGGGFGGARGFSKVYFGTTEASYEFPAVCANSVWRDKQIIVKVPANLPDGSHEIKIKLDGKEIDSKNANPNVFLANANASLKTSICKISPTRGQIDTRVSLWGEYFGDNGSQAVTEFTYQRATSSQIDINQGANRVMPLVPAGAVTGPVKVIKNNEFGNDINFEIGTCTEDADCGTEICCPADTYKQGRCASALAECYLQIPSSVFEWNFSTGFGNVTSTVEYDSCQGMAQSLGACQIGSFCPNSPGLCSPYAGKSKVLGACDASCATVGACAGNSCTYNAAKDRCVLNNAVCDLSANFSYTLGNESFETIKTCQQFSQFNNQKHWQIKVSTSCPTGWTRLAGNVCVDSVSNSNSTCSVCATGLNCQDINQTNVGSCVTSELCAGTASCAGTQCLAAEASRCDCCCTIGEDARDCCAPLTCTGTCGSDVIEGDGGLGQCSGCAIKTNGVFDVAASDQACNCSNHSGKYCDTSVPTGACVDCSSLTTKESCLAHSQSCCFDSRGTSSELDDVCRGGDGKAVSADPANPSFGYCAYFDCQSASSTPAGNPALCASSTPKTFGLFKTIDACTDGCTSSPGLSFCGQHDGDLLGCSAAAGCCFNFSNQKCNSGQQINGGYCAYYNCQAAPNQNQCNPVPNNTGVFSNLSDCANACAVTPLGNLGKDCRNLNSTSTTSCNQSFCSSPFACLNDEGAAGLPGDCGTCCCQVGDPNSCAGIGSGNLVCQPNQAPCSGEDRGLCCGCSQDLDCGNADTLGCDSGTCCRARPEILNNLLKPAHGAEGVCRNTVLQIPFDQAIDYESLSGNILLLEERLYSWQTCPAGTFIAENGDINNLSRPSWLARTYDRLIFSLSSGLRHLGWSQAALAIGPTSSEKIYCTVPGEASLSQSGEGSVIEFAPSKLLAADAVHYLIIKGDEALNSVTGILSQWGIGMNGAGYLDLALSQYIEGENVVFNGKSYKNSYISSFKTLSDQGSSAGICAIDYIKISPESYLFQTTENDPHEIDNNYANQTFDTKNDKDKVFAAIAYSADGQALSPNSGYFWDWEWQLGKPGVVKSDYVSGLAKNKTFISAIKGVTDDSVVLSAKIKMDRFTASTCNSSSNCICEGTNCSNNCCNFYQDGDGTSVDTSLFVFLCKNPWPPVNKTTMSWNPWSDNCVGAVGNCSNYSYNFYYCRDAGGEGFFDDLPSMNPAIIRGYGSDIGTVLICSEGNSPCTVAGAACGPDNKGFCVWNVLKESYFFKESAPQIGELTDVQDRHTGTEANLSWYGNADLIYSPTPSQRGKYRVYYAPISASSLSFVDVEAATACTPAVPASGQNYDCSYRLAGLKVGETYRVKVSAISANKVESPLSSEKVVTVTDTTDPALMTSLTITLINNQKLRFSWTANTDDTLFYRIYHGTSYALGESFDSENYATVLELDASYFSPGQHYFSITAVDASQNESYTMIRQPFVMPQIN